MQVSAGREKVRFASGGTACAAWRYRGTTGACVVMGGGLALTKERAWHRRGPHPPDGRHGIGALNPGEAS
jgi:hypothetical protein